MDSIFISLFPLHFMFPLITLYHFRQTILRLCFSMIDCRLLTIANWINRIYLICILYLLSRFTFLLWILWHYFCIFFWWRFAYKYKIWCTKYSVNFVLSHYFLFYLIISVIFIKFITFTLVFITLHFQSR